MQRLLSEIGRTQSLSILQLLKRSDGMAIGQLAGKLGMSYMGVKQHCQRLERQGYLDVRRRHRGVGRPELVYRVSVKAMELFPRSDNGVSVALLEQSKRLYGANAAEKILYLFFQQKAEGYLAKIQDGTLSDRARSLAALRDAEGYMAEFDEAGAIHVVERHSPLEELISEFPMAEKMEREMYERVTGSPVRRETKTEGGRYLCVFTIGEAWPGRGA